MHISCLTTTLCYDATEFEDGTVLKPVTSDVDPQLIGGKIATQEADDNNIQAKRADADASAPKEGAAQNGSDDSSTKHSRRELNYNPPWRKYC